MKVEAGQRLYFWNSKTNAVSTVEVTKVSSDGLGFQFRYNGKLAKCTYAYAKDKLWDSQFDAAEYHRQITAMKNRDENPQFKHLDAPVYSPTVIEDGYKSYDFDNWNPDDFESDYYDDVNGEIVDLIESLYD